MTQRYTTEVWVTGMALCSALGATLPQTWQALLAGKTGILCHQPWSQIPALPLGLLSPTPAKVSDLLVPLVTDALVDSGLSLTERSGWGVALGSSRGYQADLEALMGYNGSLPLASVWEQVYGRSPAIHAAQQFLGTEPLPIQSPRAACATGLWAIAQGADLIRTGQCERVLAGAVEAPVTPLTLAGFRAMGALASEGAFPFDQRRHGFVLGEGAALLVLERADLAHRRGARPYGKVLEAGLTNDAYHCSAPAPDGRAAIAAIQTCVQHSRIHSPHPVGYIHAHGTGTRLNDQREAALIQALFNPTVAISSTKGATGHTLGASGALGAAFCLMALYKQTLPPCVGLQESAFDLNWVVEAQTTPLETALCLSFGFGGQNAAIAFGKIAI